MKRDNDYIRELLFEYERSEDWLFITPGITHDDIATKEAYHVRLMMDDGLLVEVGRTSMRMTSRGHDFLEAIRSDTIWKKTKDGAAGLGGVTLGMLKDIAVAYLKKEASERLGISFD